MYTRHTATPSFFRVHLNENLCCYDTDCTLSEAWSGVNWAELMAAQGAFGTDFYDRSTRTIVGTMLWTEYIDLS